MITFPNISLFTAPWTLIIVPSGLSRPSYYPIGSQRACLSSPPFPRVGMPLPRLNASSHNRSTAPAAHLSLNISLIGGHRQDATSSDPSGFPSRTHTTVIDYKRPFAVTKPFRALAAADCVARAPAAASTLAGQGWYKNSSGGRLWQPRCHPAQAEPVSDRGIIVGEPLQWSNLSQLSNSAPVNPLAQRRTYPLQSSLRPPCRPTVIGTATNLPPVRCVAVVPQPP